jgi:tetrahedral aminopeptidase
LNLKKISRPFIFTAAVNPNALDYFLQSLQTPSPSGFEELIQSLNRRYVEAAASEVAIDVHGNLIARARPTNRTQTPPRLMFAGHCDQIGMLVSYIDDQGFVYAQPIGGWDSQQLIGQAMSIWGRGGEVPAVISRKPIHLLSTAERQKVVELEELWLDIGASNRSEAETLVRVGDPVTLQLRHRSLAGDRISGPGMDNKSGMWTVMEAFRLAATSSKELRCDLYGVATVQEEIGLRGAKTAAGNINPDVAIAVDVTHASDCPTIDKQRQGDVRVGAGPVIFRGPNINRKVADRLESLARENELPYQLAAIGRATSNDANALQIHGGGVAVGLVAIANRYMHSAVEVISTQDMDHAARLLSLFALSLSPDDGFIPSAE